MFNNLPKNKELFLLLAVAVVLVLFVLMFSFITFMNPSRQSREKQQAVATPTPYESLSQAVENDHYSTIQKTTVGETTDEEVEILPDVEEKEDLSDGRTLYSLESPYITRKNEILTQDGVVVFERILAPEQSSAPGHARISEYTRLLGDPQESLVGSRFYGPHVTTFIYADRGLALIGNTHTDEVFEIHTFTPTTVEQYRQLYGQDIDESLDGHVL
jgi:hypothetical protein